MSSAAVSASPTVINLPLAGYPGINRFALDLVEGSSRAARYCRRSALDSMRPPMRPRGRENLVAALARSNAEWGNEVADRLQQWERGESITIVAGQQVGFAGGPLYTLAKLASLIALERDFAKRGIPATLFFWLATEDHDYDEVAQIALPASFGLRAQSPAAREGVVTLRATERPDRKLPVGGMPLPASLRRAIESDFSFETTPSWLQDGVTFRDSFARLIASVIPRSVVLVDALLPELRRDGAPLLVNLACSLREAHQLVRTRSAALEADGYVPQVQPREGGDYPILYHLDERTGREAVDVIGDGKFRIGSRVVEQERLCRLIEDKPESVSTGVLARPLLQDFVFRPDIFVGGPAEVAYYAQLTPLHDRFEIAQPHVALRGHAVVAPEKVLRAVDTYALERDELFLPADKIIARHESVAMAQFAEAVARAEERIVHEIETLRPTIVGVDSTLDRSIERSIERIRYQFDKLAERGQRAIARRDRERHQSIVRLAETLTPCGVPQDRLVGWIGYWMLYGDRLVERIVSEIEPDLPVVKVLGL